MNDEAGAVGGRDELWDPHGKPPMVLHKADQMAQMVMSLMET